MIGWFIPEDASPSQSDPWHSILLAVGVRSGAGVTCSLSLYHFPVGFNLLIRRSEPRNETAQTSLALKTQQITPGTPNTDWRRDRQLSKARNAPRSVPE
ncbi:hypothetical protein HPB47_022818 [Ixodes persulcatus]|uniref:Uncharacterized protein n=1 Tax=Ixodes persulcatus TaxID=34615 RepID=A0AC60Q8N2_IXOPE|nr:hypothetical protein HPB47_022818 [Ixodes persulcatus]